LAKKEVPKLELGNQKKTPSPLRGERVGVRGGVIRLDFPLTLVLSPMGGEGKNQETSYIMGY